VVSVSSQGAEPRKREQSELTCGNRRLSTETIDTRERGSDVVEGNRRNGDVTSGSLGENCLRAGRR